MNYFSKLVSRLAFVLKATFRDTFVKLLLYNDFYTNAILLEEKRRDNIEETKTQ